MNKEMKTIKVAILLVMILAGPGNADEDPRLTTIKSLRPISQKTEGEGGVVQGGDHLINPMVHIPHNLKIKLAINGKISSDSDYYSPEYPVIGSRKKLGILSGEIYAHTFQAETDIDLPRYFTNFLYENTNVTAYSPQVKGKTEYHTLKWLPDSNKIQDLNGVQWNLESAFDVVILNTPASYSSFYTGQYRTIPRHSQTLILDGREISDACEFWGAFTAPFSEAITQAESTESAYTEEESLRNLFSIGRSYELVSQKPLVNLLPLPPAEYSYDYDYDYDYYRDYDRGSYHITGEIGCPNQSIVFNKYIAHIEERMMRMVSSQSEALIDYAEQVAPYRQPCNMEMYETLRTYLDSWDLGRHDYRVWLRRTFNWTFSKVAEDAILNARARAYEAANSINCPGAPKQDLILDQKPEK